MRDAPGTFPPRSNPRRGIATAMAVVAVLALAALAATAHAQPRPQTDPAAAAATVGGPAGTPPGQRPRVGLVLSGGGARGLAHVGVLKVLERERVPVDVIAGTSMGAIIGGLYASGMGADEIERELRQVDWSETFTSRVDRTALSQRRKEEDFELSPLIDFGFRDGAFRAPAAAVASRELELLLRRYTLPVRRVRSFDGLPIPFRAIATDLENGRPVLLAEGDLALAMRSSMSVPGVFAPTEVGGRILGDGGLVDNVPIDVARSMGADVVVVVNIGTPLAPRETLSTAVGVTVQMINILTEQNVQRSLATLRPADVLIAPDLGNLTAADFEQVAAFVERGMRGAEEALERLRALAVPPPAYAAWRDAHRARLAPAVTLDFIAFEGTEYTNPARFASEFESRPGEPFEREKAERDARRLAASGDYLRTDYRIVRDGDREGLVFGLVDKPWGPNFLRVGLALDTDFRGDSRFNLTLGHTRHWLTPEGGEWRNLVRLGSEPRLHSELYHPLNVNLGLHDDWFVAGHANAERRRLVLYTDDAVELAQFLNDSARVGVDFGRPWRSLGEFRLGVQWLRYRSVADSVGAEVVERFQPQSFTELGLGARLVVDQLDYAYFPTAGYRVVGTLFGGRRDRAGSGSGYTRVEIEGLGVSTVGRHTFDLLTVLQTTNDAGLRVVGRYTLGGFHRLSGYRRDELNGNAVALLRLGWRTPITGNVPFARALTVGATLEAGNAWPRTAAASWSDLRTGSSLYVGSDTGLGPVHLGLTYAPGGSFGVWFVVGRP